MVASEQACFAGGCFWCVESAFAELDGVLKVESGYTDGQVIEPSYEEVCSGDTGHTEAVRVEFDPSKISYQELLDVFLRQIDPTDKGGQFADRGSQYRTGIYYYDAIQKQLAESAKLKIAAKFDKPIVVEIKPVTVFYPAEEYHQQYYKKQPTHYQAYKVGSGRAAFIERVWGACPLKPKLTKMQHYVTQECGTEPPFQNEYWDNKEGGIYVDVVSGEVLFSSLDKFDSGTGWPSFTQPVDPASVVNKKDSSHGMLRIEVRSKQADSHLGHVFPDGPNGQQRYCINSAALRFISVDKLEAEGYAEYKKLFSTKQADY